MGVAQPALELACRLIGAEGKADTIVRDHRLEVLRVRMS